MTMARLDSYTKDEWQDVARTLVPNLNDTDYDKMWEEFMAYKSAHEGCEGSIQ